MRSSAWFHLLVLTLAFLVLQLGSLVAALHDRRRAAGWDAALERALLEAPSMLFGLLPAAVGIAVATLAFRKGGIRTAAWMVAAVIAVMIAVDTWIGPALDPDRGNSSHPLGGEWKGAVRTLIAWMRGEIQGTGEILRTYPPGHPRFVSMEALARGATLLLPVITVGIVLGIGAWMRNRVIFRTGRDEIIARWVVAFLIAPVVAGRVASWSSSSYEVLFRGKPLWIVLIPYVPFLVLAALGWRAARRAERDAVPASQWSTGSGQLGS